MKRILFGIVSFIMYTAAVQAQVLPNLGGQRTGLATFSFLKNDMNPRSNAMGGASVSVNSEGYSTFSNPAYMPDLEGLNITYSSFLMGAGIYQGYVSAILPSNNSSALGISVNHLSSGQMEVRTEFQPQGTGQTISANTIGTGVSYARRLSDMFTFGLTGRYIYEQLAEYTNHTFTFDLGFAYQTDWKDLSFAVMLQNFGGNSTLKGDYLEVDLNRSGVSLENYASASVFRLGFSLIPYQKDRHTILFAFELDHPSDNAENFRMGLEYNYIKVLYLRVGYKINVADHYWPVFGLGLRSKIGAHPLMIDYSAQPTGHLGVVHNVGLSFTLNNDKRE